MINYYPQLSVNYYQWPKYRRTITDFGIFDMSTRGTETEEVGGCVDDDRGVGRNNDDDSHVQNDHDDIGDDGLLSRYLNVLSLINQFSNPTTRADLVNGNIVMIHRDKLSMIDEIRCHLLPWFRKCNLDNRNVRQSQAQGYLENLCNKSSDKFPFEDTSLYRMRSFAYIYEVLNQLAVSNYWDFREDNVHCPHIFQVKEEISQKSICRKVKNDEYQLPSTRLKMEDIVVISSDDSSSDSVSSSDESEEDLVYRGKRRYSNKGSAKEVVTPPMFSMDGKTPLIDYLVTFEQYFQRKYAGSEYDKTQLLEKFLQGDLLNVYKVKGGRKLKYKYMKEHLLKWFKKQKVGGKNYWKVQLDTACPEEGESYDLYGMRLLELGELAYGAAKRQGAKQVRKVFLNTISTRIAEKIIDTEDLLKVTNGKKKFDFSEIMEMAEKYRKKQRKTSMVQFSRQTLVEPTMSSDEDRVQSQNKNSERSEYHRNVRCHHCKKFGHTKRNCWKRSKSCLICGEEHFMKDCPKFDPNYRKSTSEGKQRSQGN